MDNMFGTRKIIIQLVIFAIVQNFLLATEAYPADGAINSAENKLESTVREAEEFKITIFPWNNHVGRGAQMEWTKEEVAEGRCKEVPTRLQRKVRSLNTHDNCVVLFSGQNCDGARKVVKVGSPSHNRLSDICFQKRPMSARPCRPEERKAQD